MNQKPILFSFPKSIRILFGNEDIGIVVNRQVKELSSILIMDDALVFSLQCPSEAQQALCV